MKRVVQVAALLPGLLLLAACTSIANVPTPSPEVQQCPANVSGSAPGAPLVVVKATLSPGSEKIVEKSTPVGPTPIHIQCGTSAPWQPKDFVGAGDLQIAPPIVHLWLLANRSQDKKPPDLSLPPEVLQLILLITSALVGGGVLFIVLSLVRSRDGFVFRRHWGGFGGESYGWNLSMPLARFATGLLLLSLGSVMAMALLHRDLPEQPADSAAAETTAPPTVANDDAPSNDKAPGSDVLQANTQANTQK